MLKIFDSTNKNWTLKQVADKYSQMNSEGMTQLFIPLEDFKDLFDGTSGDWGTEPVNLELNTYSKPFNSRYYMVPIINKEKLRKELKCLVYIVVLTPVQQSQ